MTLSPDLILQAVRRLGFDADSAHELAVGFTNHVYRAGDYVVRVSREPEFEDLHGLEADIVPSALAAGLDTPKILALDDSKTVIPATFTIYPWVDGQTLGSQRGPIAAWKETAKELGRQAARLHAVAEPPISDPAWWPDPHDAIDTLTARETFTPAEGASLHNWAKRLELNAPEYVPTLVHNDLHPWNVMVHNGRFSTILDWANGGVGDPALDFAGLPLELLPAMLEGYREEGSPAPFFEAAILRRWLGRALEEQTEHEILKGYARDWQRWPAGGLAEIWLIIHNAGPDWSPWSPE